MKKYFLKIASLTTMATPLVAIVACTPDTKETTKETKKETTKETTKEPTKETTKDTPTYDFSNAKTKIIGAKSSKDREELLTYLRDKRKGAKITSNGIGYTEPTNLPDGVTIDSEKYTLEEVMPDNSKTFKIKVTLKKDMEETTKIIEITAKAYDFGPAKEKLKNNMISTKNKVDLIGFINAKEKDYKFINSDLNAIGYAPPILSDGVRIIEYKLGDKTQLVSHGKFELKVTLAKGSEKAEHTIQIVAPYDFGPARRLFKDATSTKKRFQIIGSLPELNQELQITEIGYKAPTNLPDGVSIDKITLHDKQYWWEQDKFQVKIILKKGNQMSKPILIEIKAAYDFDGAKALFKDLVSSKTQDEINLPDADQTVTPDEIGYEQPNGLPVGVEIEEYKLKSSWDPNEKFRVIVTLKKGDERDQKEIIITAKPYDFTHALSLIESTTISAKMKSEFTTTSPLPPLDTITSDLKAIGYTKPAGWPDVVTFTYKIKSPGWKSSPNANKFDVDFILEAGIHKSQPKPVEIEAKQFSMDAAKELFKDAESSKTKTEINASIAADQMVTADEIGYNAPLDPTLAGITLTYKVKSPGWQDSPNDNKFDIEVSIQKNGVTKKATITITAKPEEEDIYLEWAKKQFKDVVTSSKMKVQIKLPLATDSDKTLKPSDFGYTNPDISDPETSITVEKYLLKRGWGTTDSEKDKFIVTVILKRNDRTATKDIKVQAKAFSLQNAIELFKDATSSKLKGSINLAGSTATDQIVTADEIGYNAPLDPTLAGITLTYKVKSPGWQASPNDNKFEIEVSIQKNGVTKTQTIKITAAYDFTSVKGLFGGTEGKVMSSKMKAEMQSLGSKTLKPSDFGYTPPDQEDLPDGVTIEYILKRGWGDTDSEKEKFIVTVILKKGDEIAKKDIEVKATAFSLEKAIKLFETGGIRELSEYKSTKKHGVLSGNLRGKSIGDKLEVDKLGFKTPLAIPSDVTLEYQLERSWGNARQDQYKFKVKVILKKGDIKKETIITIRS